jgi:hypothetical protein
MRDVAAACPPGGDGVQQHGAETLGRPVDGSGETCRSAAHHDQVDDLIGIRLIAQPEALRDHARSGPQDRLALDERDGQIIDRDPMALECAEPSGGQFDRGMGEVEPLGEAAQREEIAR